MPPRQPNLKEYPPPVPPGHCPACGNALDTPTSLYGAAWLVGRIVDPDTRKVEWTIPAGPVKVICRHCHEPFDLGYPVAGFDPETAPWPD